MMSSKSSRRHQPKKRNCCHALFMILVLFLMVLGGGIVLWVFLPEGTKAPIQAAVNQSGAVDIDLSDPFNLNAPNNGYVFDQCQDDDNCCNGLDTICDLRADQVLFAGSHNAMAARANSFLLGFNHRRSLEESLNHGYRAINVDMGKCGDDIVLVHGRCSLGTRDAVEVFSSIAQFLQDHPTEILLVTIQINNEVDGQVLSLEEIYDVLSRANGFASLLYQHPDTDTPWPTLRELRDSQQKVLLFHYNGESCLDTQCPPGMHDWFAHGAETEFSFPDVAAVRQTENACAITRGSAESAFFGINMFVTLPSSSASEELNQLESIRSHVHECSLQNGKVPNVVFVDFWSEGDLPKFVQEQNTARARNFG